ncbi:MAG: hypothetical protein HG422_08355 [Prevotella sp.]|nr:hypothetical protein [Prevotella sp.]
MTREEKIRQVAQKYIATDKHNGVGGRTQAFIDGAEWADENPATPWHSVADGDLPKGLKNDDGYMPFVVKTKDGKQHLAYYASWFDEEYRAISHDFFDDCDCPLDVEYWMEIPELPK